MRLLMACSRNRVLARSRSDDMRWTGRMDKNIFRALTGVGGVCAVGGRTWDAMPMLPGRELIRLSRSGYSLRDLQSTHPDAWLLGGPTVAKAALLYGLVEEFHLCVVDVRLDGSDGALLGSLGSLPPVSMETLFDGVTLEVRRFD